MAPASSSTPRDGQSWGFSMTPSSETYVELMVVRMALPSLRADVLVQVEDVVRVIGGLEGRQPGELRRRVRAADTLLALVAERVDVHAAGEGVQCRRAATGRGDARPVLGGV